MKVRQIKKRSLNMMQNFLKRHWKFEKENWKFDIQEIEQQNIQIGLGVKTFAEKILQEHQLFSKRIESSEPFKIHGLEKLQNDMVKHILAGSEDSVTISSNA